MRTEYAGVNGSEKIPLFVDSSPGWNDYQDIGNTSIKPISTDISAGMQEYIFGRNIGSNGFGVGSGMIAELNPATVLLTGAGKSKGKKKPSSKVAPKKKSPSTPSKVAPKKKSPISPSKVAPKKKSPISPSKVSPKKKSPSTPSKVLGKKKCTCKVTPKKKS